MSRGGHNITEDNKACIDPELCIQCGLCATSCPTGAIVTVDGQHEALRVEGPGGISLDLEFECTDMRLGGDDSAGLPGRRGGPGDCEYWVGAGSCFPVRRLLQLCPTGAVSIENGKSRIRPGDLIGCGMCQRGVEQRMSIYIEDTAAVQVWSFAGSS
jgi:ferredoxin